MIKVSVVIITYNEEKNIERIKTYCIKDVVTLIRIYQCLKGLAPIQDEDIVYA